MSIGLHDLLEEALPLMAEDLRAARIRLGTTSTGGGRNMPNLILPSTVRSKKAVSSGIWSLTRKLVQLEC